MYDISQSSVFINFLGAFVKRKTENVTDETLKSLAEFLPTALLKSRADNTVRNYLQGLSTWKQWAQNFKEVEVLPAKEIDLALFISSTIQCNSSYAKSRQVYCGVK